MKLFSISLVTLTTGFAAFYVASVSAGEMPPAPVGPYWSIEDEKAGRSPINDQAHIPMSHELPTAAVKSGRSWQWGEPNVQRVLQLTDKPAAQIAPQKTTMPDLSQIWGLPEPVTNTTPTGQLSKPVSVSEAP